MAYSLSEAGQQKYVNVVDITPASMNVNKIPLTETKPIDHIKATSIQEAFDLIEAKKEEDTWVYLDIQTDRVLTPTEIKDLRKLKKDIVIIRPILMGEERDNGISPATTLSIEEEFLEFYKSKREGTLPSPETLALFLKLSSIGDHTEHETD